MEVVLTGYYGDILPFTLLSNGSMIGGCRDFLESSFPVWHTMSRSVGINVSEYFWSTTTMRFTRTGWLSPARQMVVLLLYAESCPLDPCSVGRLRIVESSRRNPSSIQWVYQCETTGDRPLVSGMIWLCSDGRVPPDCRIPLRGIESSTGKVVEDSFRLALVQHPGARGRPTSGKS